MDAKSVLAYHPDVTQAVSWLTNAQTIFSISLLGRKRGRKLSSGPSIKSKNPSGQRLGEVDAGFSGEPNGPI